MGVTKDKAKVQRQIFCIEYLKDWNATEAAIRAGYSKKSAYSMANELLKRPEIRTEIAEQIKSIIENAKIPLEKQILDHWLIRAFYDITDIIDLEGNLKIKEGQSYQQFENELREKGLTAVIDGVEKRINSKGETYIKYKFADKDEAKAMLQKYIGMIKEQQPQIQQNNTYIDLKALILNQAKSPKEKERIIAGLEKLSDYQE